MEKGVGKPYIRLLKGRSRNVKRISRSANSKREKSDARVTLQRKEANVEIKKMPSKKTKTHRDLRQEAIEKGGGQKGARNLPEIKIFPK